MSSPLRCLWLSVLINIQQNNIFHFFVVTRILIFLDFQQDESDEAFDPSALIDIEKFKAANAPLKQVS